MHMNNVNSELSRDNLLELQKTVADLKQTEEINQRHFKLLNELLMNSVLQIDNLSRTNNALEGRVRELEFENEILKKLDQLATFFNFGKYEIVKEEAKRVTDSFPNLNQSSFFKFFSYEMHATMALSQYEEIFTRIGSLEVIKQIDWAPTFIKWRLIAMNNMQNYTDVIVLGTNFLNQRPYLPMGERCAIEGNIEYARSLLPSIHSQKGPVDEGSAPPPKRQKPNEYILPLDSISSL